MDNYIKSEVANGSSSTKANELISSTKCSQTFKTENIQDEQREHSKTDLSAFRRKYEPLDSNIKIESDDVDIKPLSFINEDIDIKDEIAVPQADVQRRKKSSLQKHLGIHTGEETLQCNICNDTSSQKVEATIVTSLVSCSSALGSRYCALRRSSQIVVSVTSILLGEQYRKVSYI